MVSAPGDGKTRRSSHCLNYRLPVLFWSISALCAVTYHLIGSSIDEQGVLVEPFALIPLFWLFLLLGCIALLGALPRWKRSQNGNGDRR